LGRRISKTDHQSLTTVHYLYDGEDILFEFNGTNTLLARYTHGPGIDEPLIMQRDLNSNATFEPTESFFYHTDGLGSITELTNSTSTVTQSYLYDSFGNPTIYNSTGSVIPESLIGNPYLFTGREFDSESGLYFYRARYYDARMGRFVAPANRPNLQSDRRLFLHNGLVPKAQMFLLVSVLRNPKALDAYGYGAQNPVNFVDFSGRSPAQSFVSRSLLQSSVFARGASVFLNLGGNVTRGTSVAVPNGPFCPLFGPGEDEDDEPPPGLIESCDKYCAGKVGDEHTQCVLEWFVIALG